VSERVIVAVDGGNSKTDVALVDDEGALLALVRGSGCSPHHIGTEACVALIDELLASAREQAQLVAAPLAAGVLLVAGADLESEEHELRRQAGARAWAQTLLVGNDTLAVLRAGSDAGFGVAVVCGAGINALAVGTDGTLARFPALGAITGDWGGGADLGLAALGKAVRAEDGRGRATALRRVVADHFAQDSALAVAIALHRRRLQAGRLLELAPLVLAAADDGDEVAIELRERLASEIVAFVRAAATRALADVDRFDVVLGGSVLVGSPALATRVTERLALAVPAAAPRVCTLAPVAGAALLGLELIDAPARAAGALRAALEGPEPGVGEAVGNGAGA